MPRTCLTCYLPLALAAIVLTVAPALALTPAVLVGPDLEPQPVRIQGLGDGVITFFDADQAYQTRRVDQFLQIRRIGDPSVFTPEAAADAAPNGTAEEAHGGTSQPWHAEASAAQAADLAFVDLTDGQRLPGKWVRAAQDGQAVAWRHPALGETAVALEQVRAIHFGAPTPLPAQPTADTVILTNNDSLAGFVEAVTDTGIQLLPDGQSRSISLPIDRVRTVILANPPDAEPARGHLAVLADGGRLRAQGLVIEDDQLALAGTLFGDDAALGLPLAQVRRIDLASSRGRLVDLADLPMTVTQGGSIFGRQYPPQVSAAGLLLHAPITARFDLPAGARRLAASGELALLPGDVPEALRWADFEVTVLVDDQAVARAHLHQGTRTLTINEPLEGQALELRLDPGVNGPVMDRLRLTEAVVLVVEEE